MRDSLLLFTAYNEKFRRLSDAQFGRLLRDLMAYQSDGVIPEYDDFSLSMAFDVMRADVDAVNERYDAKCAKLRENGAKGGRPKGKDENQMVFEKPNGFVNNQMVSKKPNATYKEKDKEKDKDNDLNTNVFNITSARGGGKSIEAFRDFWELYPRKEKEDAACRTWISLKPDEGLVQTIMAALRKNIEKNGAWKRDGGRYIPTAENWLLERRWKDEIKEEKTDSKKNQFNDFDQRTYSEQDYRDLETRMRQRGLK